MTKTDTAILATLEANQNNMKEALIAHQEFTADKFRELAEVLNRIEIQTVKINGRTFENEKDIASLKIDLKPLTTWKEKLGGIWFTVMLLGGAVGGLIGLLLGLIAIFQ